MNPNEPSRPPGREIRHRTPEEKLAAALKEYADAATQGRNVIVTDYAAVLFCEEFEPGGEIKPSYLHISSKRSSWHSLRGLVQTLADYVYRLKP